jgi:hypothetical protein
MKTTDLQTIWFWPMHMAQAMSQLGDLMVATPLVVGARSKTIAAAMTDPTHADVHELRTMISEKVDAFGQSQRAQRRALNAVKDAHASAGAFAKAVSTGSIEAPVLGWRAAEQCFSAWASLALLPLAVVTPVHARATANARRLSRPSDR